MNERAGLDCLKRGDLAAFGDATAEDAVFVDSQGPATKAEVMEHTAGFHLSDYSIEDVRFVPVSAECGNSHGHDFKARVYVSSLWAKRQGKWVCLFSQETSAR